MIKLPNDKFLRLYSHGSEIKLQKLKIINKNVILQLKYKTKLDFAFKK